MVNVSVRKKRKLAAMMIDYEHRAQTERPATVL
jgi:hypothetical protein